jgi:hypothetical protein
VRRTAVLRASRKSRRMSSRPSASDLEGPDRKEGARPES